MNSFLVLHFNALNASNNEVIVNIHNINAIYASNSGGSLLFMTGDNDPVAVSERPCEVMELILNNR